MLLLDGFARYRYKVIKEVGDGTFGTVWRALNRQTGEVVSVIILLAFISVSVN